MKTNSRSIIGAIWLLAVLGLSAPIAAQTRATTASLCQSTETCLAESMQLLKQPARGVTSELARTQDLFYWFGRMNMAAVVVNTELGIIPPALAVPVARGVAHSIDQGASPQGKRPTDVLQTEKIITDFAGPEATLIHTGRSRQDMHPTLTMGRLRIELLDYADQLIQLRLRLLEMAGKNIETFIPAYTNGVQAMPISLAHYLLAYAESFARDAQRIHQAWARVDRSPLGSAVLANSSWPLNRERLAQLLGFEALAVNGYDGTQISPNDVGLETAHIAESSALRVGMLMQDIHVQYHQTRPWLLLVPGKTYTSSAMPQKANPGVIQDTRGLASDVVASVHNVSLRAHNVNSGMTDYKYSWTNERARTFVLGVQMLADAADVIASLRVDPARSLEELESDWTTSMELAETLQREHQVPFRIGHHFASEVVLYAKEHGLKPKEFPYAQAIKIYEEAGKKYQASNSKLPLSEAQFRRTLSPEWMVRTRVGIGGPQPESVRAMLAQAKIQVAADQAWSEQRRMHLAKAEANLNREFLKVLAGKP
jgi:argininosuccinate lyase